MYILYICIYIYVYKYMCIYIYIRVGQFWNCKKNNAGKVAK